MKNFLHSFFYVSFFGFCSISLAQTTLNAYAKVTAIAASKQLTVTNVNIANHTFAVGQKVVIMQMQDDVIGGNTGNGTTFGDLSGIASAGLYEVNTISSVSPAAGTPTQIVLSANLANTYNTGANSSVQLITFRNLGASYSTTNSITGLAWNGSVGGVIAIEVAGPLTLNHSISADHIGFRGGDKSIDADETCSNGSYRTSQDEKGYKGEGIYKSTTTSYVNGRGKILNGGGGGSQNNTGGGGGGNYTAGGNGGQGWQCTNANSGYGLGAISLSASINASRIFMGGGGGGGQQNNSSGTDGGNGGGIILLKAGSIITGTNCTGSIRITANGEGAVNSNNDGSGGGGAGGSIVLQSNTYSVNPACAISISASGGDGGDVTNAGEHGGGGGGGQGAIIFSAAQPTSNVTTSTNNGAGGTNNTPATSTASSGSGNNNSGVINNANGPLPTELIGFTGTAENDTHKINWVTSIEMNNDYFTLERSSDGLIFIPLGTVKSSGNSYATKEYEFFDNEPLHGVNYYRLKQTDRNGTVKYSWVILLKYIKTPEAGLFPNPVSQNESICISFDKKNQKISRIRIFEPNGKLVYDHELNNPEGKNYIELQNLKLQPGVYIVNLNDDATGKNLKLIIQ